MHAFERIDEQLVCTCAHRELRSALEAVFALDQKLRHARQAAREPLLGAIKCAWWREQLQALDTGAAPAEPLLQAVSRILRPGVSGALLSGLADEETRAATLVDVMGALCGPQSRRLRLWQALSEDDARRLADGRPFASPARRSVIALRIVLIGR
jgi:phytoene/squalene synthetase